MDRGPEVDRVRGRPGPAGWQQVLALLALATFYFVAARLGLQLAVVHASATAVWPPTGIAIAALLLGGNRLWPGVTVGAFAANVTHAGTALTSLGIATGNTLEAVAAAWLVRRFAGGDRFFDRPHRLFRYTLLAGILAPAISASVGVLTLALAGLAPAVDRPSVWLTWWLGDAAGALVVAPLLVTWMRAAPVRWSPRRAAEAALAAGLLVAGLVVFEEITSPAPRHDPTAFACIPFLAWISFRFGPRESTTGIAVLAAIAIHGTLMGRGPFARGDLNQSLLLLQAFLAVIAVLNLAITAAVARQQRADEAVRAANAGLEERVRERTDLVEVANQKLRETEARLLEAQRLAGVGSWEWEIGGDRVWWSEELYRLYGLDPSTLPASYQGFLDRVHPEDRERVNGEVAASLRERRPFRFEHRVLRPDGTVIVLEAQGQPVLDQGGRPVRMVGTGQDIRERKRAEDERAQLMREQIARREAEEANRVKDAFLATLSHELRTPLNSILGWTGLLESEELKPEDARRALSTIRRNAIAQSHLISDILDLSSIESGKLTLVRRPADLADVIGSAADSMRPEAERRSITLRQRLEPGITVVADVDRMHQVVLNLLSNAIKFIPEGGVVDVSLERDGTRCRIAVEDDGPGIPPELLPHVFDRFRQGDSSSTRQHRGLGLGLAIVERLIALHGGTVTAQNRTPGHGARITIYVPIADGREIEKSAKPGIGKWQTLPVLRGLRLMVVDDDRDSRELTVEILSRAGAEVSGRGSAAEAREAMRNWVPDVLVTDIEMPVEDGYSLLKGVRALPGDAGDLPAVALTAYARPEDAARAAQSGFDAHLPKPVDPNSLIRVLGALAHRRKSRPT